MISFSCAHARKSHPRRPSDAHGPVCLLRRLVGTGLRLTWPHSRSIYFDHFQLTVLPSSFCFALPLAVALSRRPSKKSLIRLVGRCIRQQPEKMSGIVNGRSSRLATRLSIDLLHTRQWDARVCHWQSWQIIDWTACVWSQLNL